MTRENVGPGAPAGARGRARPADEIRSWLREWVAAAAGICPDEVDTQAPFESFGLPSREAVVLSGDLEDWLERRLPATLVWEYPSIEALTRFLAMPDLAPGVGHSRVVESPAGGAAGGVAIVGMSCRFPGAENLEAFWRLLRDGVDAIREVPADRWDIEAYYDPEPGARGKMYTRWGGFISNIDQFDPKFFGISPREAARMDPQQRLLLEVAWEALENAGLAPDQLAGSDTGVFAGISSSDYSSLQFGEPEQIDAYAGTGNAHSIAANRLSYFLDLRGPSFAVDTACSSSLVAVHLACQSIRSGECELALAGGVNAILSPEITIAFSQARMMAPDGRCKTFDASANGYVRGEGCGFVVLKPLARALEDGDHIYAVIRGSAVNHDGRTNGLTAPNGAAQQALIRRALRDARVDPADIDYVEAHGTGTSLGDPIEVEALKGVLLEGRPQDRPLAVGSVKTNIGHLEAAAGIAGLMKLALALDRGLIPPHLHLKQVNPLIDLNGAPITIPTAPQPWPERGGRRVGGVSAFGFGGASAHAILESPPRVTRPAKMPQRPWHVLSLSARSEAALKRLAAAYAARLEDAEPDALPDVCLTANAGRSHFERRCAFAAESIESLRERLEVFANAPSPSGLDGHGQFITMGEAAPGRTLLPAFLFTGQGSQYAGMGKGLFETQPVFRGALERCDALLRPRLGVSLVELLYGGDSQENRLDQTGFTQPALFALEYALAQLWLSWGVRPAAVLGHSVGEFAAACVAGAFSLEDGLALIAERGRLMQALPEGGKMAACLAPLERVQTALEGFEHEVAIGAINGPNNTVISGSGAAVDAVRARLESEKISVRPLVVSHAFHSPLLEPALDEFEAAAAQVEYLPLQIPLVSNLTGAFIEPGETLSAAYWRRHARSPVQFTAGMRSLAERGVDAYIEVGPQPTLIGMGKRCLDKVEGVWAPSLKKGQDDWRTLVASVSELYAHGAVIDWRAFDSTYARGKLPLPTYPFERSRYWFESRRKPPAPEPEIAVARDIHYALRWLPRMRLEQCVSRLVVDYIPPVDGLCGWLDTLAGEFYEQHKLAGVDSLFPGLDRLCGVYAAQALSQLGWAPGLGARVRSGELAGQLGVVPAQRRLFGRLIEILCEDGVLEGGADGCVTVKSWEVPSPESVRVELAAAYPSAFAELALLERCGEKLADVLKGAVDPLEAMFPGGSFETVERLYEQSPVAAVFNRLVGEAVAHAIAGLPRDRVLRVIEIGAGTGGTTSAILPKLPAERTEYVFTDLSPLFMARAKEKFGAYPFVRYEIFDVERDPVEQGFAPHQFDVVIAANVLHATADLRRTLANVRRLLAPGGGLVMLEGTGPLRFLDLTFGLMEGWWKFSDAELRPRHALLRPEQWRPLLLEMGFAEASYAPTRPSPVSLRQQAVVVARAAAGAEDTVSIACAPAVSGNWLIVDEGSALGGRLADVLGARGQRSRFVRVGGAGDVERVLSEAQRSGEDLSGVVYLPGAGARDAVRVCETALALVQAVAKLEQPPRIWFVTQRAQAIEGFDSGVALEHAPLWGFARSVALEQPKLWGGVVDVGPGVDVSRVCDELLAPDSEDQVALRASDRFVARLMKAPEPAKTEASHLRQDAAYVITGGLGGVGLEAARWLARRGAGVIALLTRRAFPSRETWDALDVGCPEAALIRTLKDIEALGAKVCVYSVDVSDEAGVRETIRAIESTRARVRGVLHAAGVAEPCALTDMTPGVLAETLRPKVDGALALHACCPELDFFVCFSSIASAWGSKNLAHYAAANQFLDAFAVYRRAQGLPCLSVQWGWWEGLGMMAGAREQEFLAQFGGRPLPAGDSFAALEALLESEETSRMVASMDWDRFHRLYEFARPRPLLEPLTSGKAKGAPAAGAGMLDELADVDAGARRARIEAFLRKELAAVLYVDAASIPGDGNFMELGLDSLMAMDMIKSLEREFRITIYPREVFERPTLAQLSAYLAGEVDRALGGIAHAAKQAAPAPFTAGLAQRSGAAATAKAMALERKNAPVVFLLSGPRSGSTLLRVMLGGHPGLFCPPELHLLPYATMRERSEALGASYLDEGVQRALMELEGLDAGASKAVIEELIARDTPIPEVYARLQERCGRRLLVDKTPSYVADLNTLERAELIFEGAKYIHLVRHPYAMIESFVRKRLDKLMGLDEVDPMALGEEVWASGVDNVFRFLRRVEPGRHYLVKYEDLVADPEKVMRGICAFLGLPFDSRVLRPYEGERMTDGIHAQSRQTGDPDFHTHTMIEARLGEKWREIVLPRELGEYARRMAQELNYDLPREGVKGRSSIGLLDSLLPIQPYGNRPPLFFAHPAGGVTFPYYNLIPFLEPDQPFYSLQDPALESSFTPLETVEEMAAYYVKAVRNLQPHGPYYLGGWSFGGALAFEMAQQFYAAGEEVALLVMIDTESPSPESRRNLSIKDSIKLLINQIRVVRNIAFQTWPYFIDGFFLLGAKLFGRKGKRSEDGPTIREYANWAWADAMRQYFIRESEFARALTREQRLFMVELPTTRRVMRLLRYHARARNRYQPKEYPGRITMLLAEEQSMMRRFYKDRTLGWGLVAPNRVDVLDVPGNHVVVLMKPYLDTVGRVLNECLVKAQEEQARKRVRGES